MDKSPKVVSCRLSHGSTDLPVAYPVTLIVGRLILDIVIIAPILLSRVY